MPDHKQYHLGLRCEHERMYKTGHGHMELGRIILGIYWYDNIHLRYDGTHGRYQSYQFIAKKTDRPFLSITLHTIRFHVSAGESMWMKMAVSKCPCT